MFIYISQRCFRWVTTSLLTISFCFLSLTLSSAGLLPSRGAITDANAILRYALPIDNQPIREVQSSLEDISNQLRGKRWNQINSDIQKAANILTKKSPDILKSVAENNQTDGEKILTQLTEEISNLQAAADAKDKNKVQELRSLLLQKVGDLEQKMVAKFPYEIPEKYQSLPHLKGRSTIAIKTSKGDLKVIVDGYSAPITAGNFVDLVNRGFYNGLPFTRAEDNFVVQVGDPPGKEIGFIDPKNKQYRAIPLEVLVKGDKVPSYEVTLEDSGRFKEEPVLPFNAYGALVMAHSEFDPNDASSQFFFFLFDSELTPAGRNVLDGRYAVFGYVVEGKEVLDKIRADDKIESAKIIDGLENLVVNS